jgi:hypothetical protein
MTGFESKRQAAKAKLDDDDAQGYIADYEAALKIAYEIGFENGKKAQRKPLTDEAIWRQYQALWPFHPAEEPRLAADMVTFARAIEAAHGITGEKT